MSTQNIAADSIIATVPNPRAICPLSGIPFGLSGTPPRATVRIVCRMSDTNPMTMATWMYPSPRWTRAHRSARSRGSNRRSRGSTRRRRSSG